MKRLAAIGILLLVVTVVCSESAAAQCAMCRQALASPQGQHLAAALRRGIVVLLAAPFMLFGVVATIAIRSQQRRQSGGHLHGIRDAANPRSSRFCRQFGTPKSAA